MKLKIIHAGNCMMCGKQIELEDTKDSDKLLDVFFCAECAKKEMRNKNEIKGVEINLVTRA